MKHNNNIKATYWQLIYVQCTLLFSILFGRQIGFKCNAKPSLNAPSTTAREKNVQTVHKREIIYYSTSVSAAVAVYNHILKQIDVNDNVELILFTIKQHKKPK